MTEPTTQQWSEIETELFAGRKIQAIKLYREATRTGLKEAKDAVEAREHHLRAESPARFNALFNKPAKSGCFSMILLAFALTAGVAACKWHLR